MGFGQQTLKPWAAITLFRHSAGGRAEDKVMSYPQIHYELYIRRKPNAPWTLDLANEDRAKVLATAEEMLKTGSAIAVRVTKETLDEETREFRTVTILTKGDLDTGKAKKVREDKEPLCISPSDLYSSHARDRIGRLLEGWLLRNRATPFELLHRPDLVELLDASGTDLQHAIQKIAIPEAQDRGLTVHELIRSFQSLVERSIQRVMKDGRRKAFPNLSQETFAAAAERVSAEGEAAYLLGGAVAMGIAKCASWSEKVEKLLDMADGAPTGGGARALALQVLEQPLAEILGSKAGLFDLLGNDLDLGQQLSAMTRLAGAEAVEALISVEKSVAKMMPPLGGAAARLANWLDGPHFESARIAVARRVLSELTGPRRLKPGDPEGEIATLRALAMALTAAAGRVLSIEEVHEAFTTRSKMLVASTFVETLLTEDMGPREEAEALIRLAENVTGAANKRQACRWIDAIVAGLKFEKDLRHGPESGPARLASLASLQKALNRAGLVEEDCAPILTKLGDLGGLVEADSQLVAGLMRSQANAGQKLNALMRMASGDAAPLGPAADRARAEAMKLVRSPELRHEISGSPETLARVRDLIQSASASIAA
jgi:hypothetical protein